MKSKLRILTVLSLCIILVGFFYIPQSSLAQESDGTITLDPGSVTTNPLNNVEALQNEWFLQNIYFPFKSVTDGLNSQLQSQLNSRNYSDAISQTQDLIKKLEDKIKSGEASTEEVTAYQQVLSTLKTQNDTWGQLRDERLSSERQYQNNYTNTGLQKNNPNISPYVCEIFSPSTWPGCAMKLLSVIFNIVLWVISWILWLATKVLNFSIDLSINQFRDYTFSNGVQAAWKICRDIANIFFIFILLYIAINTVINRAGWERMVGMVIGMALLVNFSAVIPRTIIDISNMFAVQIYNNMVDLEDSNGNPDISGAILAKSQKLIGYAEESGITANPNEQAPQEAGSMTIRAVGAAVLMMAVVFVLIVAAVLFIYRTLALIIAIIVSPLAVMAWALPKQSHFADKWLNTIIKESFYAPIFLFFLYIALKIYSETTFTSTSSVAEQVIMFILFYGMVMFAITAAREAGARGSDQAVKMGNKFKGLFTGAAAGLAGAAGGAAGVYALGRTAQKLTEKDWYKNADKKWWGRMGKDYLGIDKGLKTIAGSKYGSSQSYSARVEKAAERVTQWKSPEDQLAYMMSLGDTDRKAAWKKLTDRQKSLLQQRVGILDGNDDRRITIDSLVGGMSIEDREKLDKSTAEAEKQKSEAEARQKVADLSSLVNEGKKRRLDEKEPYETDLKGNPDKSRPKFKVDDNKAYVYEDITSTELKRDSTGNLPSNLQLVNRMFDQDDKVGEEAKKKIKDMVKDINVDNIGQVKKFLFKPVTDDKMSPEEKEQAKNMNTKLSEIIVESMEIAQLKKIMQVDKSGLNQEQIDGIARVIDNLPDSDPRKERIRGDSRFASFFKQDKTTKEQKSRGPKVEGLMGNNGQPIK